MRELKFDLNIDSTALLNANPVEFFSKAYISEDIVNNFRTLPGIKSKTKIATTSFSNLLKASDCNFSTTDGSEVLSAVTIDVFPVSALSEICRFDIEASYLSLSMAKGSGASFEVQPFMNFYWDQMAKEIAAEVEVLRWQGNTAGTGAGYTASNAYKKLADGYEKILLANTSVVDIAATASITTTNVLGELAKIYNQLATSAPQLINKTADLRFYVSPNIAAAYRQAVAAGNTLSYVTKNLDFSFLDIKLVTCEGMSATKAVLTLKDNLIYAFDGEGDGKALKAVNLEDSIAEPKLRTRANLKIGFFVVNGAEIVYYS
jgi:hypothetical protein